VKHRSLSLLTVMAIAFALLGFQPPAIATNPVRIMPLGDSITGSPGCWRSLLWNQLRDAGFTGVDFVGTLPPTACGVGYDGDNEGHAGLLAKDAAFGDKLVGWLRVTNPDIVLMHFGTNDVWNAIPVPMILASYSRMVDQMRANNPRMTIIVQQLIPMNPANCPPCASRVVALNAAIPSWAASVNTARSPVVVVNQWPGFSTATDTYDGVHPNDSGAHKIANRLYPTLTTALANPKIPFR
jgi:lysophospholipase L1-like esterase